MCLICCMFCQCIAAASDWEKSGNGTGMRHEGDEEFGHAGEEHFADGDNRKNFLNGAKSHMLYYWQFMQDNDLLSHCLAQSSDAVRHHIQLL